MCLLNKMFLVNAFLYFKLPFVCVTLTQVQYLVANQFLHDFFYIYPVKRNSSVFKIKIKDNRSLCTIALLILNFFRELRIKI